jgi:hypothetical protein
MVMFSGVGMGAQIGKLRVAWTFWWRHGRLLDRQPGHWPEPGQMLILDETDRRMLDMGFIMTSKKCWRWCRNKAVAAFCHLQREIRELLTAC